MKSHEADIPSIGTHVQVFGHVHMEGDTYQSAIVVGHWHDPALGSVIELRLSDSRRLQRTWPTSTIRLLPTG